MTLFRFAPLALSPLFALGCDNAELKPLLDGQAIGAVVGDSTGIVVADLVSAPPSYGDEGPHVRSFVDGALAWEVLLGENTAVDEVVAAPGHVALVVGSADGASIVVLDRSDGARTDLELDGFPDGLTRDGDGFAVVEMRPAPIAPGADRANLVASLSRFDGTSTEPERQDLIFEEPLIFQFAILNPAPRAQVAINGDDVAITFQDASGTGFVVAVDGDTARVVDTLAATDADVDEVVTGMHAAPEGVVAVVGRRPHASVAVPDPLLVVNVRGGVAERRAVDAGASLACVSAGLAGVVSGAEGDQVFVLDDALAPVGEPLGTVPPRGSIDCFPGAAVEGIGVTAGDAAFFVPL